MLCVGLGALAYVVAGYFLVDLPPRGISLDGVRTWVRMEQGMAGIRTTLTYKCHSWRARRATVYLPFGPNQGKAQGLRAVVPPPSRYRAFEDGVLLDLVMAADSEQTVECSYQQPLSGNRFVYQFSVSKGWPFPPNLIAYEFDLPAGKSYRFPGRNVVEKPSPEPDRSLYLLDGQGGDVVVEW